MKFECPDKEKAVAIAADVLKHLDQLNLVTSTGYLRGSLVVGDETDLKPLADQATTECSTCLLGACLLSKARLYDAVPLSLVGNQAYQQVWRLYAERVDVIRLLSGIFGVTVCDLMECFFERCRTCCNAPAEREIRFLVNLSLDLSGVGFDQVDRVRLVMEHLVRHGGVLDTEALRDEAYATLEYRKATA